MARFDPLGIRREGHGRPAPQAGGERFFYLLWSHGWKLVGVNLLFILFSLPIITLPAALCAMDRVLIKLARDGNVLFWEEFRDEFKGDFLRSLPLGLLYGGLFALVYLMLSMAMGNLSNIYGPVFLALALVLGVFTLSHAIYAFLMRAMFPLNNRDLLKNAGIMSRGKGCRGLLAAGIVLAALALVFMFFPYSLAVVVLCGFSLPHYIICYVLNGPIQKKIISPWEEMQKRQEARKGGSEE